MGLSLCGEKMTQLSGLRGIMEDIATTARDGDSEEWLNLSIGNPAAIAEVIAMWRRLTGEALSEDFENASCRYGASRGAERLVNAIVDYFNRKYGWGVSANNVVVGPGSQMLCFIAAALYSGPFSGVTKRIVLPAIPDYTGYQGLCMNEPGPVGVLPELVLTDNNSFRYRLDLERLERTRDIGLMLLSSPSNPTGRVVGAVELAAIIALAESRGVPVVVDHAYGQPFPQIVGESDDPVWHPNVINCFTASKAGIPGERIGFAIASESVAAAMTSFVANSALHAPQLSQLVLARALETGALDWHVEDVIRPYYANKRRFTEKLLLDIMPQSVRWRLHGGSGGLFCWVWIDEPWFSDEELYSRLKLRRVFIVPGRHFFVGPERMGAHETQCIRLSLTADEDTIVRGIERLAETLEDLRAAACA